MQSANQRFAAHRPNSTAEEVAALRACQPGSRSCCKCQCQWPAMQRCCCSACRPRGSAPPAELLQRGGASRGKTAQTKARRPHLALFQCLHEILTHSQHLLHRRLLLLHTRARGAARQAASAAAAPGCTLQPSTSCGARHPITQQGACMADGPPAARSRGAIPCAAACWPHLEPHVFKPHALQLAGGVTKLLLSGSGLGLLPLSVPLLRPAPSRGTSRGSAGGRGWAWLMHMKAQCTWQHAPSARSATQANAWLAAVLGPPNCTIAAPVPSAPAAARRAGARAWGHASQQGMRPEQDAPPVFGLYSLLLLLRKLLFAAGTPRPRLAGPPRRHHRRRRDGDGRHAGAAEAVAVRRAAAAARAAAVGVQRWHEAVCPGGRQRQQAGQAAQQWVHIQVWQAQRQLGAACRSSQRQANACGCRQCAGGAGVSDGGRHACVGWAARLLGARAPRKNQGNIPARAEDHPSLRQLHASPVAPSGGGSSSHAAASSSTAYGPSAGVSLNSASRSALDSGGRSGPSSAMAPGRTRGRAVSGGWWRGGGWASGRHAGVAHLRRCGLPSRQPSCWEAKRGPAGGKGSRLRRPHEERAGRRAKAKPTR